MVRGGFKRPDSHGFGQRLHSHPLVRRHPLVDALVASTDVNYRIFPPATW